MLSLLFTLAVAGSPPLEGHWVSGCRQLESTDRSEREAWVFTGSKFKHSTELYQGPNCTKKLSHTLGTGTFRLGMGQIVLTHARVLLEVHDHELQHRYNRQAECGIDDWRDGKPRDVAGRSCGPMSHPSAGAPMTWKLRITDGTLGLGPDAETMERQPFVRQVTGK